MATITKTRINEIIREEIEKLIEKSGFQQKVDAAKKMLDSGKSEKQVLAKYGQTVINAVNSQNEYM